MKKTGNKPPFGGKWDIKFLKPRSHKDAFRDRLRELEVDPEGLPKGFATDVIAQMHGDFVADRRARAKARGKGKVAAKLTPFSFYITQAAAVVAYVLDPRKTVERFGKSRLAAKLAYAKQLKPVLKKHGFNTSIPEN